MTFQPNPTESFRSMDPLYRPGLDENGAVDELYTASWIGSETALLPRKKHLVKCRNFVPCSRISNCSVQNFSTAVRGIVQNLYTAVVSNMIIALPQIT